MGQHKHNPTAQAAARGELPPKPRPMGAAEQRRALQAAVRAAMWKVSPAATAVVEMLEAQPYDMERKQR